MKYYIYKNTIYSLNDIRKVELCNRPEIYLYYTDGSYSNIDLSGTSINFAQTVLENIFNKLLTNE